jgi:hypothetical protein
LGRRTLKETVPGGESVEATPVQVFRFVENNRRKCPDTALFAENWNCPAENDGGERVTTWENAIVGKNSRMKNSAIAERKYRAFRIDVPEFIMVRRLVIKFFGLCMNTLVPGEIFQTK